MQNLWTRRLVASETRTSTSFPTRRGRRVHEERKAAREQAEQAETQAKVKEDVKAIRETTEKTERKTDIVLVKQEETRKAVNRIDQRDKKAKKNARQSFSVETQELVYGYWERGRDNSTLRREAGHHRVSYEQVFCYYKDELTALGIKTVATFKTCLGSRSDRIAYSRRKTYS